MGGLDWNCQTGFCVVPYRNYERHFDNRALEISYIESKELNLKIQLKLI